MPSARRFLVRGRVQGVFFRDSTRQIALSLGLAGHAINLANGDVEVMAFGDVSAIDELHRWLREGPPLSRVMEVVTENCDYETRPGFIIG